MILPVTPTKRPRLMISVRQMDSYGGKRVTNLLFDLFKKNCFEKAAIFLLGNLGYDSRCIYASAVLGLSVKLPGVTEIVESKEKILRLLSSIREIVGSHGPIVVNAVDVI